MRSGRPEVPRVDVRLNKLKTVPGIIDSGAVLSIVSQRLADERELPEQDRHHRRNVCRPAL